MRFLDFLSYELMYFMPEDAGASPVEAALIGLLILVLSLLAVLALAKGS